MREIKFRVWNPKEKRFMRGEELRIGVWPSTFSSNIDWFLETETEEGLPQTGYILLQYTGLKDKNGKEIYEGDIVNCSSGCPHAVEWRQEIGGKYGGGMPGFYLSGLISGCGEGYAWLGSEESIGNIYEHPSLLKAFHDKHN